MESTGLTYEKVLEMFKETDKQIQETSKQMKETDKQIQETSKQMKETDIKFQETDKQFKETDRKLRKLENLFVGQWGKLMESLVEGDLVPILNARGIPVNETLQRVKRKYNNKQIEIDLIAINGDEIVFVEVKTTLEVEDVKVFLEKLDNVKSIFPRYAENTIYGAVAFLRSESNAEDFAIRKGLFAIRATGNSASIINELDFKPAMF